MEFSTQLLGCSSLRMNNSNDLPNYTHIKPERKLSSEEILDLGIDEGASLSSIHSGSLNSNFYCNPNKNLFDLIPR